MPVDGSGVALMCSITLPGREIQPPSQTQATVGACPEAQVRNRGDHFCPAFSIPSSPISGSGLQRILLGWNCLSVPIPSHLSFLSLSFPWSGTLVKMTESLWVLGQNLGCVPIGFSSSTSPIHLSSSVSSGYLRWRDYNCYVNLPYVCKFKD